MLNRRLLRIKVMQSLYAFFQSDNTDMAKGEKSLFMSINRVYELYLYYLILPIELADIAEIQMEEARNKALPTKDDINPNRKFVDSFLIQSLKNNPELKKKTEEFKVSWTPYRDQLKKIWKQIKQSSLYENFLGEEESVVSHKKFIDKLIQSYFLDSEDMYSLFQENSIYWDFEDSDFAIQMAMRYFGKLKAADQVRAIPPIYKDEEEDIDFVKNLYRKAIVNNKKNGEFIDGKTKNWEVERIAVLDVLLMKMAITELLNFPSIPVKVTLNEYIDISKLFSTPKSKQFINGVLDKLLIEFKNEKLIKKTGRGLMQ